MDDPMDLSPDQIDEVKEYLLDHRDQFRDFAESDASMVNDFKSGEVVIADGGRGTTETMIKDGVPAQWIPPKEGVLSWVCGLGITSERREPRRRLQADQLLRLAEAQAIGGESGFVVMNPKALPLIAPEYRKTADPKHAGHGDPRDPAGDRGALRPSLAGGGRRMSEAARSGSRSRSAADGRAAVATGPACGSASAAACRGSRASS